MTKREQAQELLVQAVIRCTRSFPVWAEQARSAKAPTGEFFAEIVSGMIRKDGEKTDLAKAPVYTTPETAIAAWEEQFNIYATRFDPLPGEAPYVLYWRIMPEIDTFKGAWKVYSRCLISNKPPLSPQPETERTIPRTTGL